MNGQLVALQPNFVRRGRARLSFAASGLVRPDAPGARR